MYNIHTCYNILCCALLSVLRLRKTVSTQYLSKFKVFVGFICLFTGRTGKQADTWTRMWIQYLSCWLKCSSCNNSNTIQHSKTACNAMPKTTCRRLQCFSCTPTAESRSVDFYINLYLGLCRLLLFNVFLLLLLLNIFNLSNFLIKFKLFVSIQLH